MREVARQRILCVIACVLTVALVSGTMPAGGPAHWAYADGGSSGETPGQVDIVQEDASASVDAPAMEADAEAAAVQGDGQAGAVETDGQGIGGESASPQAAPAASQEPGLQASDEAWQAPIGSANAVSAASDSSSTSSSSSTQATLDPTALENGTYTVNVSLVKSNDLSSASMAASAFDGIDTLTVIDGSYVIALDLGSVLVGSITGYVGQLAYYENYTVGSNSITPSGNYTVVFTAANAADEGPANVPVGATAKTDSVGYVALRLWSDAMGSASQTAALKIDWTSLAKKGEDTSSDAFDKSISSAVRPESEETASGADSPTADGAATGSGESSVHSFGGMYEVGHVYSVPISFKKEGSSETSMAAQYFGSNATVRLNENDTFDVRFSTNRPDYLLSMAYNGSDLTVRSETSSSREYSMTLPATTQDTIVPLTMSVKPMIELGSGPVTTDMHLAFSRATDLGGDTGQSASSIPNTGDPLNAVPVGIVALAALGMGGVAVTRRKKEN